MSAIELLPCPFCGSRPIVREGKKGHCQLHGDPYQGIKVSCPTSGCAAWAGLEAGDIYNGGTEKAKAEAIAAWNRRTVLSQAAVAAALAKARAVAPLVWVDGGTNRFVAQTPFGEYLVAKINGSWRWFFSAVFDCEDRTFKGKGAGEVGAKASAQSDYEARILSALAQIGAKP